MTNFEIVQADVIEWCEEPHEKYHACFCDPPFSLNFMNKNWDDDIAFRSETWGAIAQHLHPGAFLLAFGSTRGWHRLACAIEDAEFVIQPSVFVHGVGVVDVPVLIHHVCGQAFPKSTRIDTKLDARAKAEREVVGHRVRLGDKQAYPQHRRQVDGWGFNDDRLGNITAPATPLARAWAGHRYGGQILRDLSLPIVVAQKPWQGKRLDCIVETGAGSMWVDGARVATGGENTTRPNGITALGQGSGWNPHNNKPGIQCTCDSIDWCDCEE